MRSLILLLLFSISFSVCKAQGDEVPVAVMDAFGQQYRLAEGAVFKDDLLQITVQFKLEGEQMKAFYTRKGQWKHTEKEWTFEKLPAAVQDGFRKSKYADQEIEDTKVVYRAGGTERYRVKVKKNSLQKKYLYFNEEGRLLEESLTL